MATQTYYFNAYDTGEAWVYDPELMVDGDEDFGAETDEVAVQLLTGNTCGGTDLGEIVKVEIRAYVDIVDYPDDLLFLRPVFTGGDGDNYDVGDIEGGWSNYFDITTDTNAPLLWDWAAVQALDCDVDANSIDWWVEVSKVEIRVTYVVSVTVTPAVIAAVFTLEIPVVVGGIIVEPSVIASTLTIQTPTTVYDFTVSPSTIAINATLQTPTVRGSVTFTVSAVSLELDRLGLNIIEGLGVTVEPSTSTLECAIQTPAISTEAIISLSVIALEYTIQTPTIDATTIVFPTALELDLELETAEITGVTKVSPSALELEFALQAPAVNRLLADSIGLELDLQAATIYREMYKTVPTVDRGCSLCGKVMWDKEKLSI